MVYWICRMRPDWPVHGAWEGGRSVTRSQEENHLRLFVVAAPGLAALAARELSRLGLLPAGHPAAQGAVQGAGVDPGLLEFGGDRAALYRANLMLRTANRVLLRLGEFDAVGFSELRKRAGLLPWERILAPGQPVALRVTCHKSRLYHSDAVAERVAAAIGDRLGRLPSVEPAAADQEDAPTAADALPGRPPQLVLVRLLHDRCTISADSSGDLLHRRGYRLATAKAPLRETLAAGMLLASGWNPAAAGAAAGAPAPLLDPFCGSGAIAIEAALLALGRAPGRQRRFAFMDWPDFDAALWSQLVAAADSECDRQAARTAPALRILASDRDAGAVTLARANAARAGVAEVIEFTQRAVSAVEPPPGPGWVVTNPPYGVRVGAGHDLRNLYAQFGNVLRTRCPGWQVAVLCSDRRLLGQLGLALDTSLTLENGGIRVLLGRGRVEPRPT